MVSTTANVLATIGTVCWCVQLIPQIYFNYKRKNTEGFPELMAFLWCLCAPFFAVFVVVEDSSIPIMLQPHLFGVFCTIVYIQTMYYPPVSRPKKQIILRAGLFIFCQVCLEVGFIIPLRKVYENGTEWPALIFGIIATILIATGLIAPYFELWKRKGRVVGINFLFLAVDLSGAIFSLASLAVDPSDLDIMGLVLYIVCACLEVGIFVSHFIWLIRFRLFRRSKEEKVNDIEKNLPSEDGCITEALSNDTIVANENNWAEEDKDCYEMEMTACSSKTQGTNITESEENKKQDRTFDSSEDITPCQTYT